MPKSIYDLEIEIIRKALKTLCPTLSVRRDRGTAYNWIVIKGSQQFGYFTKEEKQALEKFGLRYGANSAGISPENRRYYVEKAAKLLNIELPEELKNAYKARDEYKQRLEKEAEERKKIQENCQHEWELSPAIIFPFFDTKRLIKCKKCKKEQVINKDQLKDFGIYFDFFQVKVNK
jgi:hypothetical protein